MNDSHDGHRDIEAQYTGSPMTETAGRKYMAIIGIDDYESRPLQNAGNDARAVRALLGQLGFEDAAAPLYDADATQTAMRELVDDSLRRLGPADSLIVFFAGHGGVEKRDVAGKSVEIGYLLPVDATRQAKSWLKLEEWLSALSILPARHILVILDACGSGLGLSSMAFTRYMRSTQPGTLTARSSRRIITSVLDSQSAADQGPQPEHSLFATYLLAALRGGVPAERGTVTGSALAVWVQQRVTHASGGRQTPDFGVFEHDDRGEMSIPVLVTEAPGEPVASAASFDAEAAIRRARRDLKYARLERRAERTRGLLSSAVNALPARVVRSNQEAALLRAQIHRERAWESFKASEREQAWRSAIEDLTSVQAPGYVVAVLDIMIDCVQDPHRLLPDGALRDVLLDGLRRSDKIDRKRVPRSLFAAVLSRRSTLLRQQALVGGVGDEQRHRLLEEAMRCVRLALKLTPDEPRCLVELGWIEYSRARHADDDLQHAKCLRAAEVGLSTAADKGLGFAISALAAFYRLTHRPWDACRVYARILASRSGYSRAGLREMYLFGEAAAQLQRQVAPDVAGPPVARARAALEEAIRFRIADSRTLLALVFLRAIEGDHGTAQDDLAPLERALHTRSWTEIAALVQATDADGLVGGLALGIEISATWERLAAYFARFTNDLTLAERCLRTALVHKSDDRIAQANLARILGLRGEYKAARTVLDKVASSNDRSVWWWRRVRFELDAMEGIARAIQPYEKPPQSLDHRTFKTTDAVARFAGTLPAGAQRDALLQWTLDTLLELTPGVGIEGGSHDPVVVAGHTIRVALAGDHRAPAADIVIPHEDLIAIASGRERLDQFLARQVLAPGDFEAVVE
jgi:tetratricopeptide (TPR) repeat protein